MRTKKDTSGFTLLEAVVGIAVFVILASGVLGVFTILSRSTKAARQQTILATTASRYLEVVRNLPYSQVGTVNGNPPGTLPDLPNATTLTLEGATYKVYYQVTYIDDPADGTIVAGTDPVPNDYKQVKMFVKNTATEVITSFLTNVSPKGLESTNNAGAISIKVINASGQPVPGASVHIENLSLTPSLILDRTADANGGWIEVGLPASVNGYHIVVTKSGYSTDQTYPLTQQNPNPIKPDATVVNGQVTQVSFAIDFLSNLTIRTLNAFCLNLDGIGVNVQGAKLIGVNPDVYKFNQNFTSSVGQIALSNIEWDTYTPTLLSGQNYVVRGTSPVQQITVLPAATQIFTLVLDQFTTANSFLVLVKAAASGVPLEGAQVHLHKGGSVPQDYYAITGGSVWTQNDWSGGSGQADLVNRSRYFSDDGNVDINSVPTGVRLLKVTGRYVPAGELVSSSLDTGAASNFTTLTWEPTSQNSDTKLEFQIATNNDNATWNFKGPDGTASTRYTVPGTTISSVHDGDRYIRYKAFLSTTNDKKTPVLTSVSVNYVSGCYTPGQAFFPNLTAGNNYDLDVTLTGYQTFVANNLNISGNQTMEVLMTP